MTDDVNRPPSESNHSAQNPVASQPVPPAAIDQQAPSSRWQKVYVWGRNYFAVVGLVATILPFFFALSIGSLMTSATTKAPDPLPTEPFELRLNLSGPLQEGASEGPEAYLRALFGDSGRLNLSNMRTVLRRAGRDDKVTGLTLGLHSLQGSAADFVELRRILLDFKERGKELTVVTQSLGTWDYFVASIADELRVNPATSLMIPGPMFNLMYFGDGLRRLGVDIEVFRAGRYKSAFEPLVLNEPSPATIEQYEAMEQALRDYIVAEVAKHREKDVDTVRGWFAQGVFTAGDAMAQGLIDGIGYLPYTRGQADASDGNAQTAAANADDEPAASDSNGETDATATAEDEGEIATEDVPNAIEGEGDGDSEMAENTEAAEQLAAIKDFETKLEAREQTHLRNYRNFYRDAESPVEVVEDQGALGLIYASGEIVMRGDVGDDVIAPASMIKKLEWAQSTDDIKAVVIRIDSPGGSAVASDMIWRRVQRLAEAKPVVVSMGSVAASGGYYIAAPAGKILAEPTTITGSIGVIGGAPNFGPFRDKYGVSFHIVTQTERAALFDMGKRSTAFDKALVESTIDQVYREFLDRVARGRDMPIDEVEALAGGRVYTGLEALQLGLVDQLGGLQDAFNTAKELNGWDPEKLYPVRQYKGQDFDLLDCLSSPAKMMKCFDVSVRYDGTAVLTDGDWWPSAKTPLSTVVARAAPVVERWTTMLQTEPALALWPGWLALAHGQSGL